MAIGSWKQRCGVIGIDFGSHALKLLQLQPSATGLRAVAASRYELPSDMPRSGDAYHETMLELLKTARREGGFVGRHVVTSLPAGVASYKNMRFPPMPQAELDQAVQWEAPARLGDEQTPMTIQYLDAGGVFQGEERRRELVVMGASTSFLERHLQTLRAAGWRTTAIEVPPVALARSLGRSLAATAEDAAQVVLDVGHQASKVLIVRRGHVRFFKMIDIGGVHFDQAIAKHLNMDEGEASALRRELPYPIDGGSAGASEASDARPQRVHWLVYEALRPVVDELARELGLCLRYYSVTFRGHRPEQVALVGGEARQAWLAPLLADTAGVEVTTMDPIDEIGDRRPAGLGEHGPYTEWAVAAGLSLRTGADETSTRRAA